MVGLTRGNPSLRVSCQLEFRGQEGSGMIGGRAAETGEEGRSWLE